MNDQNDPKPEIMVVGHGFMGKEALVELAKERGINIVVVDDVPNLPFRMKEIPEPTAIPIINMVQSDQERAIEKQKRKYMTYNERKGKK